MEARIRIVQLLGRCDRLAQQVDAAFCGQAFIPDTPPDAPANVRRFDSYLQRHRKISRLLLDVLRLWRISQALEATADFDLLLLQKAKGRSPRGNGPYA